MNIITHNTKPFFFEDFINNFFGSNIYNDIPPYNIIETDKEFLIEFSVPGFNKKDFSIEVEENNLKVSKLSLENDKLENKFYKRQFNYSQFEKNFTIPEEVNIDKINSIYENGILKIFLPKIKEFKQSKIKSIQVK
ncbi:MAG: Hsp20/alpha crystallin family protein [Flavobacteriaceae bacterium]|nr:Hsp20/alpha crystallin family protein [Flavobacteriaceae bacterium]MBL6684487.1 Hsp20/alpha crystallin family protein [Flavobacteriaceae bacterium]